VVSSVARVNTLTVLRAEADPAARPHLIYAINQQNLKDFATGSDKDIGGQTECTLDVDENGDGRFWGELRREVRGEWRGKVRGGYAGFRNKVSTRRGVKTDVGGEMELVDWSLPSAARTYGKCSENTIGRREIIVRDLGEMNACYRRRAD
jgi:hypothetical protein